MSATASALGRRSWLRAALALPTLGLQGCVVAPFGTYYRPSTDAPGASFSRAWCGGQAGPESTLNLALHEGLVLAALVAPPADGRDVARLHVTLRLAAPAPLRFAQATWSALDAAGRGLDTSLATVTATRFVEVPAGGWIDAAGLRPAASGRAVEGGAPQGWLRWRLQTLRGYAPDALLIEGVALERAGGAPIVLPAQRLERQPPQRGLSRYYRSAETLAQLEAAVAQCRRDTPQRACDNLLHYADASFAVSDAQAQWKGSWRTFESTGQPASMFGEIDVAPSAPGRWRVGATAVALRDAVGGQRHEMPIAQVSLAFADRIALDAPLFPGGGEGRGETRLQLELALPADTERIEVRLPALLLRGGRIDIAPIRFERRRLDGGVQPFNC